MCKKSRTNTITFSSRRFPILLILIPFLLLNGCSIKKLAVNSVANALTSEGTSVFATDEDPELVAEALPFALKTMEALLQSTPENQKLLIGTCSGFVQYSHAFVLAPAEVLEKTDLEQARKDKQRAKKLFLRARGYGLNALELKYTGISEQLQQDAVTAVSRTEKKDVTALYWTGVAWISAISLSTNDMGLVAELPVVKAILEKSLELDESWNKGAIHEVFIHFDASRTEAEGGGIASAEKHYQRAMELNQGQSVSPHLAFAEAVCVRQQDRDTFEQLLQKVLEFNVDQYPEFRLSNILAQRKAQFLLENIEDYFI
ncbi:MAG: TRAP transporter TatT component family protein [bacterium]|nr:MAG: TRAP transporter TatT component family protein [bacterium]